MQEIKQVLDKVLATLEDMANQRELPGLTSPTRRVSLALQIIHSYRRIRYVSILKQRDIAAFRADPDDDRFDPLKASILFMRAGDFDESFWMVFYFVHFGKHRNGGWRYAREVYSSLGQRDPWTFEATRNSPEDFRTWLEANVAKIRRRGVSGGFGNHRKYLSLDARKSGQTGAAFESYVQWIGPKSHIERFNEITFQSDGTPGDRFDYLYRSMSAVESFGRMAIFDYLCMIGKVGLFDIEPNAVYIDAATGPKTGGKLLFGGQANSPRSNGQLEADYANLCNRLALPFGMQILEDAICNWQKSPDQFIPFRG